MVRSRVPSVQPTRWMTGTTLTPSAWRLALSSANSSLSSASHPDGTLPDGFCLTSRPSPEASMLWKAAMVTRSVSMASPMSSSSQLGMNARTSASTGSGVGCGVGAGVGVTSGAADGDVSGAAEADEGVAVAWPSLSTVMQALAMNGSSSANSSAGRTTGRGRGVRWTLLTPQTLSSLAVRW